ncbi:Malonate decarboxylase gamma subunit (MdcE) [compost metagenome]
MAYDLENYASLGLLWERVAVGDAEAPGKADIERVRECLLRAVEDIGSSTDLSGRLGAANRAASSRVREMLRAQW